MSRPSPERERLSQLIQQWNVDHYDLFELSLPNQDLEFHGVVRFYFQGAEGANVITKCVRVSSTATTRDVINTLIEKFRPDMRMLSQNKYALYELHVNGEERRLSDEERPLWVQLNWGKDVREGRFLLKNEDEKTVRDPALGFSQKEEGPNFKRKLSRREKKEKKKRDQELAKQSDNVSMANKLYSEAPETSFTRSISNPEAVMRRRRQQKLEKKLAQMQSRDGNGPDSGGTLKIYGESVRPGVPYKTLLLSTADTTVSVIREAMDKYGLEKEDPEQYCLVEVLLPPGSIEYHGGSVGEERVLDDGECPLAIIMQHPKTRGHIIFQLRRRSANIKQRPKRTRAASHDDLRRAQDQPATQADRLPYLIELNPRDGKPKKHLLPLNVTEVVRDQPMSPGNQYLQLSGPDIKPRHCVIAHTKGFVTVTPTSRDAEIFVEQKRVFETTMLRHGMTVQFGRSHTFRFMDPRFEEVSMPKQPVPAPRTTHPPQETNFDIDGHVETISGQPGGPRGQARPQERDLVQKRSSSHLPAVNGHVMQPDLLPCSLEFRLEAEDRLLQASILEVNSRAVQFKLAPTYNLYLAARRLLVARIQGIHPTQHSMMVADFVSKTSKSILQTIQDHHNDPTSLAFWMANSSEVLHFYKQDVDIQPFCANSQELLAEAVQMAFHHLVRCLQGDLQRVMPAFLDPSDMVDDAVAPPDHSNHAHPMLLDVLNTLSAAMTLLRRCRVNAALTIQLFSQLFHFINMWLFNILVLEKQLQLCTRAWGLRLKRRLGRIEAWAEKQGLELAADCHLCRIIQAAHLLQAPKITGDDITNISSTCFKLNSLQLRTLLSQYIPEPNEPPVSINFIERVVSIAENMADELTRTDGREVHLEEDPDLHLPFLLPEDGYSCDTIRGIPNGLPEFIAQLTNAGICQMVVNNNASGSWTVYMGSEPVQQIPLGGKPEILTVSFKKVKGSMGLSIVAAIGDGLQERGIYIKSVVPGGAAALDGRLKAGDQLLEVDGKSLVGLSQDKAAELMTQTGEVVTLRVAKQGAIYHGLATLLNEPSPTMQRHQTKPGPNGPSNTRIEEGPPPYMDIGQESRGDPSRGQQAQQRPVPQPRQSFHGKESLDRSRAPSAGNLMDPRFQQQQQQPQDQNSYNRREAELRSKSTSNLHVDTSFERNEPRQSMRTAASVNVLPSGTPGFPGMQRPDMRPNDYENQPQLSPGSGHGSNQSQNSQSTKSGSGLGPSSQNSQSMKSGSGLGPSSQQLQPTSYRSSDRSSVSSRASSNSARDMRPQSAYYGNQQPSRDDFNNGQGSRPKSDEITSNKLQEWQDKFDPQGYRGIDSNHAAPYANQGPLYRSQDAANHSPPYTNIATAAQSRTPPGQQQQTSEPRPTAHQRLFNKQPAPSGVTAGSIPKLANSNHQRQPNFYENTHPVAHEQGPPFHQLQKPSVELEKPKLALKPAITAKNTQPKVQPVDIPYTSVDNRLTQPNFYVNNSHPGQQPVVTPSQTSVVLQTSTRDLRLPTNAGDFRSKQDPRNAGQISLQQQQQHDPRGGPQVLQDNYVQHPQQDPRFVQNSRSPVQHDPRILQQPDPRLNYPVQKFPSVRRDPGPYGYPAGHAELPPPPVQDMPPELPPPPRDHEGSPPLPPPPMNDFYDQQIQDEQRRLMESFAGDQLPSHAHLPTSYNRYGQPVLNNPVYDQRNEFDSRAGQRGTPSMHSSQQQNLGTPNYQNVNFTNESRANSGPVAQIPPPVPQPPADHVYEQYSAQNQPQSRPGASPDNKSYPSFQKQLPPPGQQLQRPRSPVAPQTSGTFSNTSAWDREERERVMEMQEKELFEAREAEITELESRSYLNPQDQERLRKLKLEQEFQRRVKEIDEKGDYDVDDDEAAERLFTRDRLIQSLKEDLEKSRIRFQELDHRLMLQDAQNEKERLQRLERRLEMMEKDRQEMKERMEKRQQRRQHDHQEQLRQQREAREKQRQNYEEQKRLLKAEEEKMRQQREEELAARKQMERERLQEMQMARDQEEALLRAEIKRQNDEYITQQMLQQRQQREEQNREIHVADERRRLEAMANSVGQSGQMGLTGAVNGNQLAGNNKYFNNGVISGPKTNLASSGYQQYMNLPPAQPPTPEKENLAPPPPERKSSYNSSAATRSNPDYTSLNFHGQPPPPQQHQQSLPATKKSVSFNTDMNTYQDRTPSHSHSSYRSSFSSQSSDPNSPSAESAPSASNDVFEMPHHRPVYNTQNSTPNVIGSQEVYRDPISRIEAQKAAQNSNKRVVSERMSFRDKMKYFAQEAGEDSIKYKPKSSKTLRNIESQLNGQ